MITQKQIKDAESDAKEKAIAYYREQIKVKKGIRSGKNLKKLSLAHNLARTEVNKLQKAYDQEQGKISKGQQLGNRVKRFLRAGEKDGLYVGKSTKEDLGLVPKPIPLKQESDYDRIVRENQALDKSIANYYKIQKAYNTPLKEVTVGKRPEPEPVRTPLFNQQLHPRDEDSVDLQGNNTIRFKVPKEKVENFSVGNIANQFLDFISQPFGLSDSSFNLQSVTPTDPHDRSDPRWRQEAFRDDLNEEFRRDYQEKKKGGKVKKKKKKKSYTSKKKYSMSGGGKVASVRKPTRA
jgi:hypothetical protein